MEYVVNVADIWKILNQSEYANDLKQGKISKIINQLDIMPLDNFIRALLNLGYTSQQILDKYCSENKQIKIKEDLFNDLWDSKIVKFPENVERTCEDAFANNDSIEEVFLNKKCGILDSQSFQYCKNLRIINLENINRIGEETFEGCKNLRLVRLNPKVQLWHRCFMSIEYLHVFWPIDSSDYKQYYSYDCYFEHNTTIHFTDKDVTV